MLSWQLGDIISAMEAPVRIFNPAVLNLNRHLFINKTTPPSVVFHPRARPPAHKKPFPFRANGVAPTASCSHPLPNSSLHSPIRRVPAPASDPNPFRWFLSLSAPTHYGHLNLPPISHSADGLLAWNQASQSAINGNAGAFGNGEREATVVLLGWLGSQTKHLRRYVEWYNSRGFHAVTFVVDLRDVIWFDMGRNVEKRVAAMVHELASWVTQAGLDGSRERCLLFHTFSNTGWFT